MKATLSADVISSTKLNESELVALVKHLNEYVQMLDEFDGSCWGRVVRGDGIECAFDRVTYLLRVALLLKFHLKAFRLQRHVQRRFVGVDVRIAVALGTLRTNDRDLGIIDGEAIYDSGRALASMSRSSCRESIVVQGRSIEMMPMLRALFALVDYISSQATSKQSQVLELKLLRVSDFEISKRIGVSRSNVSVHLRRSGWTAMEKALHFFEEVF